MCCSFTYPPNRPCGDTELTTSSWKQSSHSSALTGETYIMNEMENSPEYDIPDQVRESLRRISSLNMEFDRSDSVQKTYPRQLQTATRDEIDAPSPQGINSPSFQVSLSTVTHHNTSSMSFCEGKKLALMTSEESLPEEEQLYQPLASTDKVHHEYAQIICPASQDYTEIPPRENGGLPSGRRATIASQYPTQLSTRQNSTLPHQVNMSPRVTAPQIPFNHSSGSTPVLVRFQPLASQPHAHAQCSQPHTQASVFVAPKAQPYQLPVSSQHSLSALPLDDPACKPATSTHNATREVHKPTQQVKQVKSNHVVPVENMSEASFPHSTNSTDEAQSQPWYKGAEPDSVPLAIQSHEISPYAVTPNCEIRPNPYQEPCGNQAGFRMVQV